MNRNTLREEPPAEETLLHIEVRCPVVPTFRVAQVAGMFDVPLGETSRTTFSVQSPPLDEPWSIGLIVGPSGSGKSTLASHLFGKEIYENHDWPVDRAVVDGFGEMPVKDIVRRFTAVGFSSPPSWIKPYHVLSNGEKFRCDLARALCGGAKKNRFKNEHPRRNDCRCDSEAPPVVFDEFTSVVDRNVARVASAAVAGGIRSGKIDVKFVAVTCHYDVTPWLQPDWVVDMADGTVSRRSLRRPEITLRIVRCANCAWSVFAKHHYLNASLSPSARCFLALWENVPVAFCAVLPLIGHLGRRRVSRIVTLPDYQGMGIGSSFLEAVAEIHREEGLRLNITASHPAILQHCSASRHWKTVNFMKIGSKSNSTRKNCHAGSRGRCVASFEYVSRNKNE